MALARTSKTIMSSAAQKSGKAHEAQKPAPIRVILADRQSTYRVGIRKILTLEDDLRVVAQADPSEKELAIISFVTQGMRNKEIASEVGTTEQVIKNYLRKIYDKLGVSDRLELALYCIHHQLLKNQR